MPAGALEVEVKVKTTWGKFSMVQDIHTRAEKYHMWEKADRRSTIKTRKRKAPCKMTIHTRAEKYHMWEKADRRSTIKTRKRKAPCKMRAEKYHMWEKADRRSTIKTRKRKAPCKMTTMQTEDNTSETDVPTGQGFRYPLQVFTRLVNVGFYSFIHIEWT